MMNTDGNIQEDIANSLHSVNICDDESLEIALAMGKLAANTGD